MDGDGLINVVIDRSFVDADGTRWIVDYKSGRHQGGDPRAFLDREQQRYRDQLRALRTPDVGHGFAAYPTGPVLSPPSAAGANGRTKRLKASAMSRAGAFTGSVMGTCPVAGFRRRVRFECRAGGD